MYYPQINYAVQTDVGRVRQNNEDNFIEYFSQNYDWLILGAIDGVGGYEGGEVAAKICKDSIEEQVALLENLLLSNPSAYLRQILTRANNAIWEKSRKNTKLSKMSCVASFALLDARNELLYFAHVGDTRGYLFRNYELIKFTHDHSVVGYLEDSGAILEQDALNHPRRNEILKMLGGKQLSETDVDYVEIGSHSFYSNDIVLFCSDGLTDLVDKKSMTETLEKTISLDEKVKELIAKANNLGGKDNITVALARFNSSTAETNHKMEENVIYASSKNNISVKKKSLNSIFIYIGLFLLGALTMFLLDRLVFQKDITENPIFNNETNLDELRTNPIIPDSLLIDSLITDSILSDTIIPVNDER